MQTFKWMDLNRESTKIQIKKEGGSMNVAADEEWEIRRGDGSLICKLPLLHE